MKFFKNRITSVILMLIAIAGFCLGIYFKSQLLSALGTIIPILVWIVDTVKNNREKEETEVKLNNAKDKIANLEDLVSQNSEEAKKQIAEIRESLEWVVL
jgi:cadmium resistance protein CadD (predicted permease)